MIVKADKSPNLYKMKADEYKKKAIENITKDYRKCPKSDIDKTIKEAANLARSYDLEDRIDLPTEDAAFITVKDHKASFPGRMECRLINPAKNHLGKISKVILEKINKTVRTATNFNQWQSTSSAIEWFNTIHPTPRTTFVKYDIVNFYPSIGKELLMSAIRWARSYTPINSQEIDLILHCRKTFLYFEDDCWVKKSNKDFDVSQGSYDSAEICELVGLFLLSRMEKLIPKKQFGLYRDDGLAVVDLPGPEIDRLRKQIVEVFAEHHLKITVKVNVRSTDFLDVMFDLENSSYKPYRKDVSPPIYINSESNHPRHIKKGLPEMIGRRVSDLSANKDVFSAEIPIYKNALRNAGYENELDTQSQVQENRKTDVEEKCFGLTPPGMMKLAQMLPKSF